MAATTVRQWLASIGCDQYTTILEGNGYNSVDSLACRQAKAKDTDDYQLNTLDDARLSVLGVFDGNHRRAIISKANSGIDTDFDSMLGDLNSVIKDLEAFTVPTKIDSGTLSTNPAAPENALTRPQKARSSVPPPPPRRKQPEQDFDLDLLLSDLTSFNPSEVVASQSATSLPSSEKSTPSHHAQMPTQSPVNQPYPSPIHQPYPSPVRQPYPSPVHHPQPSPIHQPQPSPVHQPQPSPTFSPAHRASYTHSTPIHNHTSPTHPHTSAHLQRANTAQEFPPEPPQRFHKPRSYSTSSAGSTSHSRTSTEVEEPGVTIVPQPDLSGATELMSPDEVQLRLVRKAEELKGDSSLTEEEREHRLKEEKMRIGIEKMKLAHKKKVAVKVFNPDRSNKTVVVEEGMTTGMVCHLLVVKNHFDESPNWVLVEQLGDVSLERELEDHEQVVEVYSTWPRENNNIFLFKQNERKWDLFEDPIKYFPFHLKSSQAAAAKQTTLERADKARKILLQEYFSSTSRVPELEGWLHLKDGYKKSWKKVYFILRASGLYYSKSGKNKSAKHLALLVQFDEYELYHGINFKKTLKAPTQYCFALRPLPKQFVPTPKDIKVICAEDEPTALSWTAGIRLSKYGLQLRDNFHRAKMTQFKLEDLTAPEGEKPKAGDRASKLVGMRLEKHMDKIREQYQAQKAEEEEKRLRFNSPHVARHELEQSQERTPPSEPRSSHSGSPGGTPQRTPEASPHLQHRQQANGHQEPQPRPPQPAPYNPYPPPSQPAPPPRASPIQRSPELPHPQQPKQVPPPVLPRPQRSRPSLGAQDGPDQPQNQQQPPPAQPYQHSPPRQRPPPVQPRPHSPPRQAPPPVQPRPHSPPRQAPPPVQPRPHSPPRQAPPPVQPRPPSPPRQVPPPVQPRPPSPPRQSLPLQTPPTQPPATERSGSPDREALFAFAWYHGAIPRDEAMRRLESVGAFDGCYLVRDSTTVANSYVLTMYAKGVTKNFQVLPVEHPSGMVMFRIDDGPAYSSIEQLLRHYKQHSDRLPCRLTEFCPRPPTRMTEC